MKFLAINNLKDEPEGQPLSGLLWTGRLAEYKVELLWSATGETG